MYIIILIFVLFWVFSFEVMQSRAMPAARRPWLGGDGNQQILGNISIQRMRCHGWLWWLTFTNKISENAEFIFSSSATNFAFECPILKSIQLNNNNCSSCHHRQTPTLWVVCHCSLVNKQRIFDLDWFEKAEKMWQKFHWPKQTKCQ